MSHVARVRAGSGGLNLVMLFLLGGLFKNGGDRMNVKGLPGL